MIIVGNKGKYNSLTKDKVKPQDLLQWLRDAIQLQPRTYRSFLTNSQKIAPAQHVMQLFVS